MSMSKRSRARSRRAAAAIVGGALALGLVPAAALGAKPAPFTPAEKGQGTQCGDFQGKSVPRSCITSHNHNETLVADLG